MTSPEIAACAIQHGKIMTAAACVFFAALGVAIVLVVNLQEADREWDNE